MTETGRTNHQPGTGVERRREAVLLAASILLHALLFFLLPGLGVAVEDGVELIVELAELRPAAEPLRKPADSAGVSTAHGTADAAADRPAAPGNARDEPSGSPPPEEEGPEQQTQASEAAEQNSAAEQPRSVTPNQATDVVPPDPVTVEPVRQPELPAAQAEQEPELNPEPVTPEVRVDNSAPPQEPENETAAPADPDINVPEAVPQEAAGDEPADNAAPKQAESPAESPAEDGTGDTGDNAEEGDGSGGQAAGPPGLPPGPTGLELDLLKDYGDNARRRIRMLARTPEVAREKKLSGKVKFEFEIARNGRLTAVKVIDSSGHPVLDEECLEATRVAGPFGRFPRDVTVEKWKFRMTLEFPLT